METTMGARLTVADISDKFIDHIISESSPWKCILLESEATQIFSYIDSCILRRLRLKHSTWRVPRTYDLKTFEFEVERILANHKFYKGQTGLCRYADLEFGPALHVEEANMLSREHFYFIFELLKNSSCSFIYLSTKNGICEVRDMEIRKPTQMPSVFLPKMVVVKPTEFPFSLATFFWNSTETCKFLTPVVDIIRPREPTRCVILLDGPVCTGKTQIAFQISQELGSEVEFHQMFTSSENKSKMCNVLAENLRRAVSVRLRQDREIYQGEVTDVSAKEIGSGSITIGLKTELNAKHLKLKRPVSDSLIKEKVAPGDVIQIDIHSGEVTKMGRSEKFSKETDTKEQVYVSLPKEDVHMKERVQDITLLDLDKDIVGGRIHDVTSILSRKLAPKISISDIANDQFLAATDKILQCLSNEKVFEIRRGVLYIDEVHNLDDRCIHELCVILENSSSLSPILIVGTDHYETRCCQKIMLKDLKPAVIIHTKSCVPADFIEELSPMMLCSVARLEKEVKFIELFLAINTFFGAGSISGIVLGVTNSTTQQRTFGYFIGVLVCCGASIFHYGVVLVKLQGLIKKAKESKSKDEVWVKSSKATKCKIYAVAGLVSSSMGIGWLLAAILVFILGSGRATRSNYMITIASLFVIIGSFGIFVKTIWKKIPMVGLEKEKSH